MEGNVGLGDIADLCNIEEWSLKNTKLSNDKEEQYKDMERSYAFVQIVLSGMKREQKR